MYDLFNLNTEFGINTALLDVQFRALQRTLHPDKFATKSIQEKAISEEASSSVNQAYQVCDFKLHTMN